MLSIRSCFGIVTVFVLAGCGAAVHAQTPSEALHKLFDDYTESGLRRNPLRATYLGDHRYDDQLTDYSRRARRDWLIEMATFRKRLNDIDRGVLSPSDSLNADVFETILADQIDMAVFPEHLIPIRQQDGPHIALAMMLLSHPFKTAADYDNYVKRLNAFPAQIQDVIERMKEGIKQEIMPPRIIMTAVLEQLGRHIVDNAGKSEFHKPLDSMPDSISAEDQARIRQDVEKAIAESVIPTYRALRDFTRETYLPKCRRKPGLCHLKNGRKWYRAAARHHVTTDLSPEEIHQIGLRELDRIHEEMRGIMKQVGFDGALTDFAAHLRGRSDMHASSAEELMRGHAEILQRSDANLPRLFGRLPKARYELKAIEPFRAPEAPMAYYYPPPEVGDRPGYFYVNVYEPEKRPKYTMEALAYHEAMPGHHLQIALTQENKSLPHFRRHAGFTVYVEGWGLYSESLGKELGGYQDPYSDYGRLTFDAWRSCRLVVDTGIHFMGWSRDKAIDFMRNNTSMTELDISAEVDRYIAWPGQALGYKIGQLAILKLRKEAEAALGDPFDIRGFHDELLSTGAIPLTVLESRMRQWIERQKQSATQPTDASR